MKITIPGVLSCSLVEATIVYKLSPGLLNTTTLTGTFFAFCVLNSALSFLYLVIIYPFLLSPFRHLPKPPNGFLPIIGHGRIMFQRPPGSAHFDMIQATPNDGLVHFRGIFHVDRLLLSKPAALAEVLVTKSYDFEKPAWVRRFLRQFLGDGLLVSEGDEHKHQRKQIMPAFHFRHIKELYPVFWSKSIELCEVTRRELLEKPDKVLEVNHLATQVTMDIIGLAGLGRDIGSLRNADDELIENYEEILEPSLEKGLYFVLHLLVPAWIIKALPWKLNERVRVTTANLKRICTDFVRDKKARMKLESEEHVDILSIMIRSNTFSDEGLVDQLLTFLAAGHETTSSALTWATHLLAIDPRAQERLRQEIHAAIPNPKVLAAPGCDIVAVLDSLPYLNAVCNETLRLFPTIPISSRVAIRDTSICGQFVPEGTVAFIIPWATNRDPSLWGEDADRFRPERWLDSESGKVNYMGGADSNYSYLTFLHGPRSCIGEKFARAELRALVAAFAGSFEMQMADPKEKVLPGGTITSKPVNGMRLRFKSVEW